MRPGFHKQRLDGVPLEERRLDATEERGEESTSTHKRDLGGGELRPPPTNIYRETPHLVLFGQLLSLLHGESETLLSRCSTFRHLAQLRLWKKAAAIQQKPSSVFQARVLPARGLEL